jgi:RNA polymerase sigma factor (sigma-70 family)
VEIKDIDIIEDILKGNKEKYALLMRKYNQRLYRIAKGYLKDEAEIEDVMQEAYIKGYQNLSKFENRSQFATWMARILINECLQRLKQLKRVTLVTTNEENNDLMNFTDKKDPETESLNTELKTLLETTIAQLPDKYRSIFIMREIEKMSVEETSKTLELTESNVKVRLNRAKEMLRNSLMNTYPLENLYEFDLVRCDRIAANVLSRI